MLTDPLSPAPTPAVELAPVRWWRPWVAVVTARRAGSLPLHCLLATLASLPSLALMGLAYAVATALGMDASSMVGPDRETSAMEFIGLVVLAPLGETLLLGGLLWLLSRMSARFVVVAAVSALLWGAAHGASGALRFFGSAWTFYVLSCSYLAWRPLGFGRAFTVAAVPHVLINLTVFIVIAMA